MESLTQQLNESARFFQHVTGKKRGKGSDNARQD